MSKVSLHAPTTVEMAVCTRQITHPSPRPHPRLFDVDPLVLDGILEDKWYGVKSIERIWMLQRFRGMIRFNGARTGVVEARIFRGKRIRHEKKDGWA